MGSGGSGRAPVRSQRLTGQPDFRARAAAGAAVLQRWYRPRTGRWKTTGWWNAANALTTLTRYTRHTGDPAHAAVVPATFSAAGRRHRGFINDFFDDNGWWALAWVAAYDLTGEGRYLDAARGIFAHNLTGWDGTCGGGVWWNTERRYKNAITAELFITLAALLHQRVPGDQHYRAWALQGWEWLHASGMIGPGGLVNDGLRPDCASNRGTTWTYNQGVILGGLASLHAITGDTAYLRHGDAIAGATLAGLTDAAGILTEPCEPADCGADGPQFKGIFVRYLWDFLQASPRPAYREFILANASSLWDNARNSAGQFGLRWAGPFDKADASRQSSALDALVAAAALGC